MILNLKYVDCPKVGGRNRVDVVYYILYTRNRRWEKDERQSQIRTKRKQFSKEERFEWHPRKIMIIRKKAAVVVNL